MLLHGYWENRHLSRFRAERCVVRQEAREQALHLSVTVLSGLAVTGMDASTTTGGVIGALLIAAGISLAVIRRGTTRA